MDNKGNKMNNKEMKQQLKFCEKQATELAYIKAARDGNLEKVKEYIAEGVNIGCFSNGALLESCDYNQLNVVSYLISSGIDIKKNNGLEVTIALRNNYSTLFEMLIRKDCPLVTLEPQKDHNKEILSENIWDYLNNDGQYLIKEGNYIKFSHIHNDRKIIENCEKHMSEIIAETIFNCLEENESQHQVKKSLHIKKYL